MDEGVVIPDCDAGLGAVAGDGGVEVGDECELGGGVEGVQDVGVVS